MIPDNALLAGETEDVASEAPGAKLNDESPWPGFEAYGEESKDFFKGREEEVVELMRLIRSSPLTVLYGKSALGKTSLLLAGAFPVLWAEHYLPVYLHLDFSGKSGAQPLKQAMLGLQAALKKAKAEFPEPAPEEGLWEYLHHKKREMWSLDNYPLMPVLVFDQFEELFSRSAGNADVIKPVLNDLADLIENRITPELMGEAAAAKRSKLAITSQDYKIVFSFREEFLADVRVWERQVPSLLRSYLRLEPMTRAAAIRAVQEAGSAVVEAGAASEIVDFVGKPDHPAAAGTPEMAIEPFLLSLCCTELNRRRANGAKITKDLINVAGEGILEKFYRNALDDPEVKGPPDAPLFIEDYLIQGDYRGDYPKQKALDDNKLIERQLVALIDRLRLLRVVPTDTARIELIHDRLVPVVGKFRDQRIARVRQEEQERKAREALAEWDKERINSKRLLRSLALRNVAILMFAVALGMFVVALGWGVFAFWGSQSRELAALAQANLSVDPQRSIGLALKALAKSDTHAARDALQAATQSARALLTLTEQQGMHQMIVRSVAFSPDGTMVVTGGRDRTRAVTGGQEGTTSVWNAVTGKRLQSFNDQQDVKSVAWSPKGKVIASVGAADGSLHIRDLATSRWLAAPEPHVSRATKVVYCRDGTRMATSDGAEIIIRDSEGVPVLSRINAMPAGVRDLDFSPDCARLATGGIDGSWTIWDTTGKELKPSRHNGLSVEEAGGALLGANRSQYPSPPLPHSDAVDGIAFSPNGKLVATASRDRTAKVWRADDGELLVTLVGHVAGVRSVRFSPDGLRVATASDDNTVKVWDLVSGRQLIALAGHAHSVVSLDFSPDGNLLVSGGEDGAAKVWNVAPGHTDEVYALAFSSDGRALASAGRDGQVLLWEVPSLKRLGKPFRNECTPLRALAIEQGGNRVATGGYDNNLIVWDVESRTPLWERGPHHQKGHEDKIRTVAFGPDGTLASGSDDQTIILWDSLGKLLWRADKEKTGGRVESVAFRPPARELLAVAVNRGNQGSVSFWNAQTGTEVDRGFKPVHSGGIHRLAFSENGNLLATAGEDQCAIIWNFDTQKKPIRLHHDANVTAVAFSHNGRLLATSSYDRKVRVWKVSSGELQYTFNHRAIVNDVQFSPDDKYLATACDDYVVRLLPMDLETLKSLAKSRLTVPGSLE